MAEPVSGEVVEFGTLEENEQIIERGEAAFIEVGRALQRIRDGRQYRQRGFDTFEAYCKEKWDMADRTAYQKMEAVRVLDVLGVRAIARVSEMATRPLAKVLNESGEEALSNAWEQIAEKHEADERISYRDVSRFLTLGANYGKAGWHELLGEVGDSLIKAEKQLTKVEGELTRKPSAEFKQKAQKYAQWADALAERLRQL